MKKTLPKKMTLSRESIRLLNDETNLEAVMGGDAQARPTEVGPGCW
jgi:hypothetical protein